MLTMITPSPISEAFTYLPEKPKSYSMNVPCKERRAERPNSLPLPSVSRPSSRTTSPIDEIVIHEANCSKSSQRKYSGSTSLSSPVEAPTAREYNVLACLSLYSSGLKLLRPNKAVINFNSIDGVKVLSLFWVITANACLISETLPAVNYINIRKVSY